MNALDEAVLALEAPLYQLATMLARDEVEAILREALDDVYEIEEPVRAAGEGDT